MTAYAGHKSEVYITGTATTMTGEACGLVSGKIYQITDTAKRIIDPATAVVVKDNSVTVAEGSYTINYMFGKITFAGAYSPTTPITIDGKYLPLWQIVTARDWSLDDDTETPDATVMGASVTTSTVIPTTRDWSGSIDRLDAGVQDYDTGGGTVTISDLLLNGTQKVIALLFGSSGFSWRGFVYFNSDSVKVDTDGVIQGSVKFTTSKSVSSTVDPGSSCVANYSED